MSDLALVVFARMDSQRLPGKVLMDLGGSPILGRVFDRLRRVQRWQRIIVATSRREVDDPVADFCDDEGVEVFRGNGDDVAGRAIACCDACGLDRFVRISGDSPFIPPELIDRAIDVADGNDADLVTNVFPRSYPPGASVELISTLALRRAHQHMTAEERENVTTHFYASPDVWRIENFSSSDGRYSGPRLTVDTREELERARNLVAGLQPYPQAASLEQVVALARAGAGVTQAESA